MSIKLKTYLSKREACEKYDSEWWVGKTDEEILDFQLYEERLCMPFELFMDALSSYVNEPLLSTLGFALAYESIQKQYEYVKESKCEKEKRI